MSQPKQSDPAKQSGQVKARVLCSVGKLTANALIVGPSALISALEEEGKVDTHEKAVEYAESLAGNSKPLQVTDDLIYGD